MNPSDNPYLFFKPIMQGNQPHFVFHPYMHPNFYPPQQFQWIRQPTVIIISDDDDVQVIPQPKVAQVLDLDQLGLQGRIYEEESSPILNIKTVQKPQKKKQITKQKQIEKHVHMGQQQTRYEQSSVKVNLIKMYEKNEEKFAQLFNKLKLNCPNANDEDVARILNIAGKDYSKAEILIDENGLSIQYYIETCRSDEETTK